MRAAGIAIFMLALSSPTAPAPLHDPVSLNIGLNCQWQKRCIDKQNHAMKRALFYVRKALPAAWRIQQCNRNAARRSSRVDWIGFDNCIRNTTLRPPPPRAPSRAPIRRRHRIG